jgi:hypothetical protein
MDAISFSLKNVFDAINESMVKIKGKQFKSNHMLIKDRLGKVYLVSEISLQDCIKNEHIIFCSYYPDNEISKKTHDTFGVAIPIALYGGLELYSNLPKHLEENYKNNKTKIGFGKSP